MSVLRGRYGVAVAGTLHEEIAVVLATMGLLLSEDKTPITHVNEGLDFLGWRIQNRRKRGTNRYFVYTYPARKAVKALMAKDGQGLPCSSRSTRCCGAGAPSSVTACPAPPSSTWAPTSGAGSSNGYGANIVGSPGRASATATAVADGGPPVRNESGSTRRRCASGATDTEDQSSRRPGRPRHETSNESQTGTCGAPGALRGARRVRETARGNGPVERPEPRLGADFTTTASARSASAARTT